MTWWLHKPVFTVFDLLETGACFEGILDAVTRHRTIAAPSEHHVANQFVAKAANANGYGYGYGGSGYGYGYAADTATATATTATATATAATATAATATATAATAAMAATATATAATANSNARTCPQMRRQIHADELHYLYFICVICGQSPHHQAHGRAANL